ncbi:hypothetical protein NAEGRDRAFT_83226 [Naegleria gruberi]|uniref:Uncharacterized protein n=1 Tax=Naegleria gruberi TaxID=5762 RepID=D2VLQ8_NAEGR|nr:uncharacterized protein NAEGRDRAFT_83226 [Naegleria gruberi]EFC42182.1 hypothetical protein NAEGRDRAFT_83226 [Naegleria gruberi]|eukprot:XP_002674926.1 hypothetical protein NAEGRDRAFT_83226 [Naegleria gruberi strain NEG-M]
MWGQPSMGQPSTGFQMGQMQGNPQMGDVNPNGSYCLPDLPSDTVSMISWCPTQNFIVASSWDGSVTAWEIQAAQNMGKVQVMASAKARYKHEAPALCCCMSRDGKIFSAGCDNKAKYQQLGQQADVTFGQHDQPIKIIKSLDGVEGMQTIVMTGSWDKSIKYWDIRNNNGQAVMSLPQADKIYDVSVAGNMAVVALANKEVYIYDVRKPQEPFKKYPSPLREQTRCVACFPDMSGFAIGSIEGRVGINYFQETTTRKNFAFKCHRDGPNTANVYAVNALSFHPSFGSFSTAGADGTFHFWDHTSKQRLHQFKKLGADLTLLSTGFNGDGSLFAYAVGYDWSKGHEHYNKHTYIYIHVCEEPQVKPKK